MLYCEECGEKIEYANYYGDYICEACAEFCSNCNEYCYGESSDGMCLRCYEESQEDYIEEDEDWY